MSISSFISSVHGLRWGTAVDNVTYLRLVSGLTWLMLLGMFAGALTAFLVSLMGGGKLGTAVTLLGFVFPVCAWGMWHGLKAANNRVHDLGFKSRYYWTYVVASIVVQTVVQFMPDAPMEAKFVAAAFAVSNIAVAYYLWVERGPKKVTFKRVEPFAKIPVSWIEKIGIGLVLILGLASMISQIFKHI